MNDHEFPPGKSTEIKPELIDAIKQQTAVLWTDAPGALDMADWITADPAELVDAAREVVRSRKEHAPAEPPKLLLRLSTLELTGIEYLREHGPAVGVYVENAPEEAEDRWRNSMLTSPALTDLEWLGLVMLVAACPAGSWRGLGLCRVDEICGWRWPVRAGQGQT